MKALLFPALWISGLQMQAAEPLISSQNVQERLAPEWIAKAKRVDLGKCVIYYRGTSTVEQLPEDGQQFSFLGEVLVLKGFRATAASAVALGPNGEGPLNIIGPSSQLAVKAGSRLAPRFETLTAKR
jgi:hypothetical protein